MLPLQLSFNVRCTGNEMKATLTDFKTGWFGLSLELSSREIDELTEALQQLKSTQGHFHYRSTFEGATGIGDVEFSCSGSEETNDLALDGSPPISPEERGT